MNVDSVGGRETLGVGDPARDFFCALNLDIFNGIPMLFFFGRPIVGACVQKRSQNSSPCKSLKFTGELPQSIQSFFNDNSGLPEEHSVLTDPDHEDESEDEE